MSNSFHNKDKPDLNTKSNNKNKEEKEKSKNKDETIDPLKLLSKDLLDQINSLEEIDFGEKNENVNKHIQVNETQKEKVENGDEEEYILEVEKESEKDIFGFEIFKNLENEKLNIGQNKINIKNQEDKGRFSQPIPKAQNINNFILNKIDDSNYSFPNGRFSYDYPQYQKHNDSFNIQFNNPLQNKLNFYNNSFTMNGKSGWVCANCKNFNYESKFIIINNLFLIIIVRIKCNRCGREINNLFNQQNTYFNNFIPNENASNGDISPNSFGDNKDYSFSLFNKNYKCNYKEKGEKGNKKMNKNKKHFVGRPGDWICYNCQNLNFAFRTNCNRCNLPKKEK